MKCVAGCHWIPHGTEVGPRSTTRGLCSSNRKVRMRYMISKGMRQFWLIVAVLDKREREKVIGIWGGQKGCGGRNSAGDA